MQNYTHFPYGSIADGKFSAPFIGKSEGGVYDSCDASLYTSNFPRDTPPPQFSVTPNTTPPPIIADYNSSPQSLDLAQFQDLIGRRNWCLSNLRLTAKEAEALRQENLNLQTANSQLNRQLSLLRQHESSASSVQNYANVISLPSTSSITDLFEELKIGEKGSPAGEGRVSRGVENVDPIKNTETERVKLPKSISIRSNGYSKTVPMVDDSAEGVRASNRVKSASEMKVIVLGGKKEEEPLELQVYNQGMTKTELCNKWQQTGACPYGDHCQFAHGIEELRPVIRHPRYKTEVCRMVLAGDPCPYGHRCHFRHALSEEEKLIGRRINRRRSFHI